MNEMLLEQNAQYRQNRTSQANLGIGNQQLQQQVPVGVPTVAVAQVELYVVISYRARPKSFCLVHTFRFLLRQIGVFRPLRRDIFQNTRKFTIRIIKATNRTISIFF